MKSNHEKGQAILLVVVAMGIFLIGALGLAIDVSQLFAHQQMAQVAADAAAQAAMLSIFQGETQAVATTVATSYARMNGFGSGSDTVTPIFTACSVGTNCAPVPPSGITEVDVTVTRKVGNSFIRMVGGSAFTTISATGKAATLAVVAPIPMLIIHPTLSGALSINGNTRIVITGGASRSIQVNSSDPGAAFNEVGGGLIDLRCASGVIVGGVLQFGADMGVFGGPNLTNLTVAHSPCPVGGPVTSPASGNDFGRQGLYRQPSSPIPDPLCLSGDPLTCNVAEPTVAEIASLPIRTAPFTKVSGSFNDAGGKAPECQLSGCDQYLPGFYPNGISIGSNPGATKTAIFQPGVYVMGNGSGFSVPNNKNVYICGGLRASSNVLSPVIGCNPSGDSTFAKEDPVTGDGMLVYNQGVDKKGMGGQFSITGSSNAYLQGTPETSIYKGILFFQDRASPATGSGSSQQHQLGGGGTLALQGTIYITNTKSTILDTGKFQQVNYHGGPCSSTFLLGMIIVDALSISGGGCVNMALEATSYLAVEQVALIGGGPHS